MRVTINGQPVSPSDVIKDSRGNEIEFLEPINTHDYAGKHYIGTYQRWQDELVFAVSDVPGMAIERVATPSSDPAKPGICADCDLAIRSAGQTFVHCATATANCSR